MTARRRQMEGAKRMNTFLFGPAPFFGFLESNHGDSLMRSLEAGRRAGMTRLADRPLDATLLFVGQAFALDRQAASDIKAEMIR